MRAVLGIDAAWTDKTPNGIALIGAEYLAGRAEAYGDGTAAIWVPKAASAQG